MDSTVGLAIQSVGIFLVTLLSLFTGRSLRSAPTRYWSTAWTCLSVSLASLFGAFHTHGAVQHVLYSLYFLGEYSFGLMFIAGCRTHTRAAPLKMNPLIIFAPFIVTAIVIPSISPDFNNIFIVHAAVLAGLFIGAFMALRPARRPGNGSPGIRVMSAALLLLALDFLLYVVTFGSHQGNWGLPIPNSYFKYTSILDLILEILLGFGTIMVLTEGVRREIEAANNELAAARDRLEQIAHMDPLTEALSRHAFHALLSKGEKHSGGCAGVIDVDNLKPINDSYGHAAGDAAIRAIAHAVRTVTRADDMLFRWGGDEFLVLMFGLSEPLARQRLDSLNSVLTEMRLPNVASPLDISVSYGTASFATVTELHRAIEKADEAMYRNKHAKKALMA